jgi:PhnB protein
MPDTTLHPYLFFEGQADEAIAFYKQALGAEVDMLLRYEDSPEAPPPGKIPADKLSKIQHASLRIGSSVLSLSDGQCSGAPNFKGFAVTLMMPEAAEVERAFAALSVGGQVVQPLIETFFTPRFGMVVDRFGVMWMLFVPKA